MNPNPTAVPRPAKDGTQPPAQPWNRKDTRYMAVFIKGRRSLWPKSFSELLSSGFSLDTKPETQEDQVILRVFLTKPWVSLALCLLQVPSSPAEPQTRLLPKTELVWGTGLHPSQPAPQHNPSSSFSRETSGLSPLRQGFDHLTK